ncbi:Eukaryotic translation initiation factor 5B [Entamoeba marina]
MPQQKGKKAKTSKKVTKKVIHKHNKIDKDLDEDELLRSLAAENEEKEKNEPNTSEQKQEVKEVETQNEEKKVDESKEQKDNNESNENQPTDKKVVKKKRKEEALALQKFKEEQERLKKEAEKKKILDKQHRKELKEKKAKDALKQKQQKYLINAHVEVPHPMNPKKELTWEEMIELEEEHERTLEALAQQKKEIEATKEAQRIASEKEALEKKKKEEEDKRPKYRSPICCVLGHVDTGKTKILDKMRRTNVQKGEAGGITQQIGSTFFPLSSIERMTEKMKEKSKLQFKIPGLLVMDTPGHEAFTNLRSRGSSLCDIAVLVVDLMHGLEPQTIESINLLKQRKTPFVVALNKIDRVYNWKPKQDESFRETLSHQSTDSVSEFNKRVKETIANFASIGINSCLYYENKNINEYISLVPTSAITGEGLPDLVSVLIAMTQRLMLDKLTPSNSLQATIMEVKTTEGHGATIDVILVNGVLHRGDRLVVCGMNGPIVTQVRALLLPQPLKDLRVKTPYTTADSVCAAQGVKISASDLENAVAGSAIAVCNDDEELDDVREEVQSELEKFKVSVDESEGVYVQASSLGSLEALLRFLKQMEVPVAGIGIGNVYKRDVMKAALMKEKSPDYAMILAFDVGVDKDARDYANEEKITIFTANIIYNLFDSFTDHMKKIEDKKRIDAENAGMVVWPCIAEIIPNYIFNDRNPLICGVKIVEGILLDLGRVIGMEINNKPVDVCKVGDEVAIKVEPFTPSTIYTYGRHFDSKDQLVSKISRQSLDLLKQRYGKQLTQDDIQLLVKLKKTFNII